MQNRVYVIAFVHRDWLINDISCNIVLKVIKGGRIWTPVINPKQDSPLGVHLEAEIRHTVSFRIITTISAIKESCQNPYANLTKTNKEHKRISVHFTQTTRLFHWILITRSDPSPCGSCLIVRFSAWETNRRIWIITLMLVITVEGRKPRAAGRDYKARKFQGHLNSTERVC